MNHKLLKTLSISLIAFSAFTFSADRVMAQEVAPDTAVVDIVPLAPLTSVQAMPSNNIIYAKGYYTIAFNTGTAGAIKKIEAKFPANFNLGNAKLIETANIGAGGISITGLPATGQTLTYTVSALTPPNVAANTKIRLMIGDTVNNGVTVAQYVSVTTKDSGGLVIDGPTNSTSPALTKVTAAMIADNAVTTAKIAANAVDSTKIAPAAVGPGQISNSAIQSNHILPGAIDSAAIADGSITGTDISSLAALNISRIGLGVTPDTFLHIAGGFWDLTNTEGDLKIGDSLYRLKIGIATAGGGAGDVRIRSHGGTNRLILGGGINDVLTVSDSRVGVGTITPRDTLDVNGRIFFQGGFTPTGGTTLAPGFMYNDAAFLLPTNTVGTDSDLRLYILDDAVDKFSIWGDSCGGGNCSSIDNASMAHSFDAAGNAYHKGMLSVGANTYPDSNLNVKSSASNGGSIRVGAYAVDTTVEKRIRFGDGDYVAIGEMTGQDDALEVKGFNRIFLNTGGNVGIGTSAPAQKLHVAGSFMRVDGGGNEQAYIGGDGWGSDVQIGSLNSAITNVALYNPGSGLYMHLYVGALHITGGADLAEPFNIKDNDAIRPGMVMAIDVEHPGELRVADKRYDQTVAGVISGANGLDPGVVMEKQGITEKNSAPVALTGRVYTYVDASYGAVKPGDLLTTSDTPGHAMKVTDYNKAQGAIIGKAMSTLTEGKGLVLVLVSLQ
ncbi:MAG: hypothetical protein HZA08_06715 [Nitrospirae bacterium]|nr:hypothetical protein [Nitrospirota bacterium]